MGKAKWIWYPGDFEIHQGMLQNFSREERGVSWPAFWKVDDCRRSVRFRKDYRLEEETSFLVHSGKQGYVAVGEQKFPFEQVITLAPGSWSIVVYCAAPAGLPAVYIEGDVICSDESWLADDYVSEPVAAGVSRYYTRKEQDPDRWTYDERVCTPVLEEETAEGTLLDFGEEITAEVTVTFADGQTFRPFRLCYGESRTEALDSRRCYYWQEIAGPQERAPRRAFRYLFLAGIRRGQVQVQAVHQYVELPSVGQFTCSDPRMNAIWKTAETTFKLCSGIFFLDGIKRDKWIWSGDAYQSYFINQYLMADEEIDQRTILALRGNDPVSQHINTIVDYSMYWVISIYNHYMATGNQGFVRMVYPKMKTMMDFLEARLDENGLIVGKDADWTFIDWADFDMEGPVCAEQMLLAECYRGMARCARLLGEEEDRYLKAYTTLKEKINRLYWNGEKGAYIDSFVSGKNHVTRHANIFAVLFEIADSHQVESIWNNVIFNEGVDKITTPYFKFYELEALCRAGKFSEVLQAVDEYWGSMLDGGAVTFWEEYDPEKPMEEQYGMYGDPYGKSLCHAWAGSPIYLIGRYLMGVRPLKPGYESFEAAPVCTAFAWADCTLPLKDGRIRIQWKDGTLSVWTDKPGGVLKLDGREIPLVPGETVHAALKG